MLGVLAESNVESDAVTLKIATTKSAITCSKLAIETVEQGVKYV